MSFKMIGAMTLLYKKQFFFLSLIVLSTLLKGCVPAAVTAGIAGVTASESEKGLGTTINDTIIHASITEAMFKENVNKYVGININVDDGIVLLTGKVDTPETRIDATRMAWKPRGVVEVINEIQVTQKSSIKDKAKDLAASTSIMANLVADKNIRSVNYNIDVVNGIAYLSGVARSEKEMNLVLAYTKETSYVNQLINYIQLSESLSQ